MRRFCTYLLLFAFIGTGTGVAQACHRFLDHHHAQLPFQEPTVKAGSVSANEIDSCNEDQCITCMMLAAPLCAQVVDCTLGIFNLSCGERVGPASFSRPHHPVIGALDCRGPPVF